MTTLRSDTIFGNNDDGPVLDGVLKYSDDLTTPADDVDTTIPRTPPVADVDYGDFESFQQSQREAQEKAQRVTRRVTPRQVSPRPQMSRATAPVRRSTRTRRSSGGGGGY